MGAPLPPPPPDGPPPDDDDPPPLSWDPAIAPAPTVSHPASSGSTSWEVRAEGFNLLDQAHIVNNDKDFPGTGRRWYAFLLEIIRLGFNATDPLGYQRFKSTVHLRTLQYIVNRYAALQQLIGFLALDPRELFALCRHGVGPPADAATGLPSSKKAS